MLKAWKDVHLYSAQFPKFLVSNLPSRSSTGGPGSSGAYRPRCGTVAAAPPALQALWSTLVSQDLPLLLSSQLGTSVILLCPTYYNRTHVWLQALETQRQIISSRTAPLLWTPLPPSGKEASFPSLEFHMLPAPQWLSQPRSHAPTPCTLGAPPRTLFPYQCPLLDFYVLIQGWKIQKEKQNIKPTSSWVELQIPGFLSNTPATICFMEFSDSCFRDFFQVYGCIQREGLDKMCLLLHPEPEL